MTNDIASRVTLAEFERYHANRRLQVVPVASLRECMWTFLTACLFTPFFFVTFFVLPMMGQIIVGLALLITAVYFYYRRSILSLISGLTGCGAFALLTFNTIQAIKYHLEVPLFIFLVLGVPITAGYCIFVASRIWILRGGDDF
jgi:hypothetical protein